MVTVRVYNISSIGKEVKVRSSDGGIQAVSIPSGQSDLIEQATLVNTEEELRFEGLVYQDPANGSVSKAVPEVVATDSVAEEQLVAEFVAEEASEVEPSFEGSFVEEPSVEEPVGDTSEDSADVSAADDRPQKYLKRNR
jgi:hypothetical protein